MKKIILSFLFVALYLNSFSQVVYQQTFGGTGADITHSLDHTLDCGKIYIGRVTSFGAGGEDILVVKTDAQGNVEWTKAYGGPAQDRSNGVKALSDGYLLTGETLSFGAGDNDALIIRTDLLGNIIWSKTFGGSSNEEPHSREIYLYNDGSILIGGMGQSFGAGAKEMLLFKLDSLGNMLWNKYYGTGAANEWGRDLTRTSSGNLLLVGTMDESISQSKFALLKTDPNGNVLWGKTYNNSGFGRSGKVIEANDGGYVIVGKVNDIGAGNNDMFIVKTDTMGDVIWARTYGGNGSDWGYEIVSVPGGYIASGSTASFGNGAEDVLAVKIDNNGNLIWAKAYGGSSNEATVLKSRHENGVITLMSSTQSFGNGNWDYYEIVMDTSGNAGGCNTQLINPVVMNHNITAVNKTISVASGGILANVNLTVTNATLNSNVLCSDTTQSILVSLNPFADVCVNDPSFILSGGLPVGGLFAGTGITNGIFDPGNAGPGTHVISYSLNCVTVFEFITVHPSPVVTLSPFASVDISVAPFALTGGTPSGGVYSGPGVINNLFNPSVAGLGTHAIIYTYIDSLSNCSGSDTASITVTQSVVVTLDPFADVCIDATPFVLTGGSPAGGMYAGPGVSNGMFDPSSAGVGTHVIVYTVNNISDTATITVHALPVVTLSPFANVDISTAAFALTGGSPTGGTYSGTGVSNGMFDPAAAGLGTHTITYNYTDSNGCSNSASATITVTPAIVVTLDPFNSVCIDVAPFSLTGGFPSGGVYSGPGVSNGVFDPAAAGPGTHTITYTFSGQTATQSITVYPLPVVTVSVSGGTIGCDNTIVTGYNNVPVVVSASSATAVSYQWYHDGSLITGATSSTYNVTLSGTYTAVVTDANGCMSDPNAPGASVHVTAVNVSCGNNNNKVVLCHYPPGNPGNPQTLCIAPAAVPAHIANHPGDCLGPCPGQRLAAPYNEDIHYHISPNPAKDKAEISFMIYREGTVKIELLDIAGRLVKNVYEQHIESDIEYTLELKTDKLPQGIYLLQFNTPDGSVMEKMTIVK